MKLYFMKEDAVAFLKGNVNEHLHYYKGDNSWVNECCSNFGDSPFALFKIEVPEFKLITSDEKPEQNDIENVKILYSALKNITNTQATDERFWVGLAHGELWYYMVSRLSLNSNDVEAEKILSNFFFNTSRKRSLIVHALAKLWWIGRLTYDPTADDPFEALEGLRYDCSSKILPFFSNNFTNNPKIIRALLKAIIYIEQRDVKVIREQWRELLRYLNMISGVIILDYLSENELKEKIIMHYKEINNIDLPD